MLTKGNLIKLFTFIVCLAIAQASIGKDLYMSPTGSDTNNGSASSPVYTITKAQALAEPGDVVHIKAGHYKYDNSQITDTISPYAIAFHMKKSGTADKHIIYKGEVVDGERPVLDFFNLRPDGLRVAAFWVDGSYIEIHNIEVVRVQVTMTGHTQSECFRVVKGSNNLINNVSMHDGMAIGVYIVQGSNNLILNCDAYNNYDKIGENGTGGNVDGFGAHVQTESSVGNVFRGCRAWHNSDDGFDLINCKAPVMIENCWAFFNGYAPASFNKKGDGSGFKCGGYGMRQKIRNPSVIPVHTIKNCIAYFNRNRGFYSNHHLGGLKFINNTAYYNPYNFPMPNRKSVEEPVDVKGYGHVFENNISYRARVPRPLISDVDSTLSTFKNNTFLSDGPELTDKDFVGLEAYELTLDRKEDGSLPDIEFLKLKADSYWGKKKVGYQWK